jgi:hypothetical protein
MGAHKEAPSTPGSGVWARGNASIADRASPNPSSHAPQAVPICAELIRSDRCSAFGIIATGHAPVLGLCRALIAAGHDPNRPLRAYRGEVLALCVRSIGEAARLRIASHGVGFERLPECTGSPPVRGNTSAVVGLGAGAKRVRDAVRAHRTRGQW